MEKTESISSNSRLIGRIKWYGGYNSKKNRDNNFGFLDGIDYKNIFVHESKLVCSPSDMKDGRWVTFHVTDSKKGLSAINVNLAENESDLLTISRIINVNEIPIDVRLKACFKVPLQEEHELIPDIKRIIDEYEHYHHKYNIEFPEPWRNIEHKSPLYQILPGQIRREWFNRVYPSIKQAINILSNSVSGIKRNTEIYSSMSPQDRQLAFSWVDSDSDYDKAKMLSARGAEKIAAEFFAEIGSSVLDVAIHQITKESDQWKSHDLLINSSLSVDVKNARSTINSNTFVEYTIKRWKIDPKGREVIIFGVLSPYLTIDKFEQKSLFNIFHRERITILGTTTKNKVKNLEREFSKRELKVYFTDTKKWPIWIFNNDVSFFANQNAAIKEFSKFATTVKPEDWIECQQIVIPAFIIAGIKVPKRYREELLPWQNWYLDKIIEKSAHGELILPWLYLFTFQHFLDAITNIPSAESMKYSPGGYNALLFYSELDIERPASLIDPAQIIKKLINTLNTLWNHRYSSNLVSLRRFVFHGEGLLTGIDPQGRKVTILAYCGGFIEGKGKCGNSPLVIGKHETCSRCQMLICNKCGHCSGRCKNEGYFR